MWYPDRRDGWNLPSGDEKTPFGHQSGMIRKLRGSSCVFHGSSGSSGVAPIVLSMFKTIGAVPDDCQTAQLSGNIGARWATGAKNTGLSLHHRTLPAVSCDAPPVFKERGDTFTPVEMGGTTAFFFSFFFRYDTKYFPL